MAKLSQPGEGGGKEGIFIQDAKIVNIKINPNKGTGEHPKEIDYILDLEFQKNEGDETYTKMMFLSGNLYKKNGNVPVNLSYFLLAVGINDLPEADYDKVVDDFSQGIESNELKNLVIGKTIKTLQFVSGTYTADNGEEKPSYRFWNCMGEGFNYPNCYAVETPNEDVIKTFEEKCEGQYPPKFTPEVLEQKNDDLPAHEMDSDEDLL